MGRNVMGRKVGGEMNGHRKRQTQKIFSVTDAL
jgi:hypothetical protein